MSQIKFEKNAFKDFRYQHSRYSGLYCAMKVKHKIMHYIVLIVTEKHEEISNLVYVLPYA